MSRYDEFAADRDRAARDGDPEGDREEARAERAFLRDTYSDGESGPRRPPSAALPGRPSVITRDGRTLHGGAAANYLWPGRPRSTARRIARQDRTAASRAERTRRRTLASRITQPSLWGDCPF